MDIDATNVETNLDDLSAFETQFFNSTEKSKTSIPSERKSERVEEVEEPVEGEVTEPVENDDTDPVENEDQTDETEEANAEDDDPKPEPKKSKKSVQERIDEITASRYEAERKAAEAERRELGLQRRLNELEAKLNNPQPAKVEVQEDNGPDPNSLKEDGEPRYPMGEYDPAYIRDLAKFEVKREQAAAEKYRQEAEQARQIEQVRAEQHAKWVSKMEETEKELPDLRGKVQTLTSMFDGIDSGYGQYLVDVVQSLPTGPRVLHYLADHPEEARNIINSGPASAAIALGRLDARMERMAKKDDTPAKTTNAPTPPAVSRGTQGRFAVRGDTDDLDAFSDLYFSKPKK